MIQANELRIGNLLLHKLHNVICEVIEVKVDCVKVKYTTDRERYSIVHLDDIQPITITEEILLKCGVEKDGDDLVLDTDLFLLVSYNDDDFVHLKSNHLETINSVKHLHQLQNLYFALTGKELEVNLT